MNIRPSSIIAAALVTVAVVAAGIGSLVDLGYAKYRGYYSAEYDLNVFKSVRYAAPPTGGLRWQAPQPPPRAKCVQPAKKQPPLCPQSGAFGTPAVYGFNSGLGSEDCLYLSVYAAPNATNLPVMVWIHGGGHSVFGATYDPSVWMNTNENGFIHVEMQYRLGAFGYLASDEVKSNGVLNAGLLDQRFAIEWVQKHISKFGGDPKRVTIGGESSGAGSVMFHALAYRGRETNLFRNIIAASPYSPPIYNYGDKVPCNNYDAFAALAGCGKGSAAAEAHGGVFKCLVAADTETLQNASGTVSTTRGYFGSFAFLPVVDGDYIQQLPSKQLLSGGISGKNLLVGTNANEGVPLTNPQIDTRDQYDAFITATFPELTKHGVQALNAIYQIDSAKPGNNETRFDTLGNRGPTALTQSGFATGIQQAAFSIAAESLFQCPAQWMAEAYARHTSNKKAWKYQFSVTPSFHGADLSAYFAINATTPSIDFRHAMQKIWGNFIMHDTPVIGAQDATGGKVGASAPTRDGQLDWPPYSLASQSQMDLNTTGGQTTLVTVTEELTYYVRTGDDVVNVFRLADALSWEGGRGARCGFWRQVGPRVPM